MARINPTADPRSYYPGNADNAGSGSTSSISDEARSSSSTNSTTGNAPARGTRAPNNTATNTATSSASSTATTATTTSNVQPAMSSISQARGAFPTQPEGMPTHNSVGIKLIDIYEKQGILPRPLCTFLKSVLKGLPPLHKMKDEDWGNYLTAIAIKFVENPGLAKLVQEVEKKLDSMSTQPKMLNLDRHGAVPALVKLLATLTDDNRVQRDPGNKNCSEPIEQRIAVFGRAISETWRDMVFGEPKMTPRADPVKSAQHATGSIQVMSLDGEKLTSFTTPVIATNGQEITEPLPALIATLEAKNTRSPEEDGLIALAKVFTQVRLDSPPPTKAKDDDKVQEKKKD